MRRRSLASAVVLLLAAAGCRPRDNGASDDVTSVLGDLGDDHFNRPADVTHAISFSAKANR